jgi:hypothetical protein
MNQNEVLLEETERSIDLKARCAEMETTEKVVWDMNLVDWAIAEKQGQTAMVDKLKTAAMVMEAAAMVMKKAAAKVAEEASMNSADPPKRTVEEV